MLQSADALLQCLCEVIALMDTGLTACDEIGG